MHRLDRGAGGIEAFQDLVAKRNTVVLAQHGVFEASDAGGKTVGIEAGHGCHAQQIAGFAVHHDDRAAFQPDPAGGVILQRAVDRGPQRIALNILTGIQIPDDAARGGYLDPARAGFTADDLFELLFQPVLADLVARRDEKRVLLLLVLLGIRDTDIADEMADAGAGRIIAGEAALRNDTGQVRQAQADCGKLFVIEPAGDFDRLIAGALVDFVENVRLADLVEAQQLAQNFDLALGVGQPFGDDVDAEIGAIGGEGGTVAVENPAPARRDERQVYAVAFALGLVPLVLGDGDVGHSHCQQRTDPRADRAKDKAAAIETVLQRRAGDDLAGFAAQHQSMTLTRNRRTRSSPATTRAMTGKIRIDSKICGPVETRANRVTSAPENSAAPMI